VTRVYYLFIHGVPNGNMVGVMGNALFSTMINRYFQLKIHMYVVEQLQIDGKFKEMIEN